MKSVRAVAGMVVLFGVTASPGRPFYACAVVMKQDLGFADAAAFRIVNLLPRDSYTLVIGVEDSARG